MSDTVEIKYEEYEKIHNGLKEGFVTKSDTSLIHKGHRAHAFHAGHDSRNPEINKLTSENKQLTKLKMDWRVFYIFNWSNIIHRL